MVFELQIFYFWKLIIITKNISFSELSCLNLVQVVSLEIRNRSLDWEEELRTTCQTSELRWATWWCISAWKNETIENVDKGKNNHLREAFQKREGNKMEFTCRWGRGLVSWKDGNFHPFFPLLVKFLKLLYL